MKRSWLVLVLCLSLGVNLGILGTLAAGRWQRDQTPNERPAPELQGRGWEGAGRERAVLEEATRRAGRHLERLADRLGLAGGDRERFVELQRRLLEEGFERRLRRRNLDREMRRELVAAEPDRERIESLIRQQAESFVESEQLTAEIILESRRLLGPDKERAYLEVLGRIRSQGQQRPWQRRGPRP